MAKIEGFFLNSTHYDWTLNEIRYGEQISRLTGGKHFVVNTGDGGQGPLRPRNIVRQGLEVLCNPVGRGLGPKPTSNTGYPNVDMFAWTSNPGESGGQCNCPRVLAARRTAHGPFWTKYALMLVQNANFNVTAAAAPARGRAAQSRKKHHGGAAQSRKHHRRAARSRKHHRH